MGSCNSLVIGFLLCFVCVDSGQAQDQSAALDAKSVYANFANAVINQRESITKYEITLEVFETGPSTKKWTDDHYWRDGIKYKHFSNRNNVIISAIIEEGDYDDHYFYYSTDNTNKKVRGVFSSMNELNHNKYNTSNLRYLPNPLQLGIVPYCLQDLKYGKSISELLACQADAVYRCTKEKYKDKNVLRITVKEGIVTSTYWVDEKELSCIYKITRAKDYPKKDLLDYPVIVEQQVEIEQEYHKSAGMYFPTQIQYWAINQKSQFIQPEFLKIHVISLNENIDPETFKIRSLNLPTGSIIDRIPGEKHYKIVSADGQLVDPDEYNYLPGEEDDPTPPPKIWRKWLIRIAILVFGISLIGFLQLKIRRMKAKRAGTTV